ncbi:MAG: glycerol kinase GlpK [Saprospiraceae bacterium]|nr:glycerol kinase GlpK [Bacteroidia bacterium]NNE16734.1 glycerol kinase GlpK [Saprospiraceae bacterium]
MSESKYIVAIDQGTSSCRALLINMESAIVDIAQQEFTQIFPQSGWVEHDANEIWETQLGVFEKLLNRNNIAPTAILGIGITNQRETTVVWNKESGEPIYNAIVWQDRRTASTCEKLKSSGHENYIKENTGLVVDAYFSGTKLKWILDNVDGARVLAEKNKLCFGTIDSWLIYKMTNGKQHITDYTNASRTMLFNIKSLQWDNHILDILNLPQSLLPTVQASASDFGEFEYKDFKIPICGVAGDQQAALFGQACFYKGMAKNTYGTGCFMLMNIGNQFISSKNGLLTTLCCNERGEVAYALEGSIFIAGAAVQWLRDGLKIISNSSETEQMAFEVKDKHDVIVVPAFAGLGAPYWNMYARGAIFGLTRGTTQNDIAKATLDALAYQTKDVLNAMSDDSGVDLSVLNVDGGAVANNYLMQFQADILQANVGRPKVVETTAMGAAYLAAIQLNLWDDKTIENNRALDRLFEPEISVEESQKLYAQWKKGVERTIDWVDKDL